MSSKQNKKAMYKQEEDRIIAHSEAFIGLLTRRGILGDQKIDDEKIRIAQQEKKKNTYHNTLMLLKNYRTIAWMLECFPDSIAEELDEPFEGLDELIDRIDIETSLDMQSSFQYNLYRFCQTSFNRSNASYSASSFDPLKSRSIISISVARISRQKQTAARERLPVIVMRCQIFRASYRG